MALDAAGAPSHISRSLQPPQEAAMKTTDLALLSARTATLAA
jgi:hypothetical protein